ncbi:hypothetical protein [Gracilibacillus massiliensis]|uniref:hypothetical protein n=1 Tax=Gracilibacillus massiliensis TaxID=1564956 RepID=UPI00071C90DD|nr:hypothetical protein [Gracilibacillus massiliensis]
MYKLITNAEVTQHNLFDDLFWMKILDMSKIMASPIDKFKVGFGWQLNVIFLVENDFISLEDFHHLKKWFYSDLKVGDKISDKSWLDYSQNRHYLEQLLDINLKNK